MKRQCRGTIWGLTFIGIFLLSQDFLFVQWDNWPTLWGLPDWMYWYFALQLILVAAIAAFARFYWKD